MTEQETLFSDGCLYTAKLILNLVYTRVNQAGLFRPRMVKEFNALLERVNKISVISERGEFVLFADNIIFKPRE